MSEVRVRFAPSPTGVLHLGGARTALFNYLFARHEGGKFLLRIEDTDRERSTDESTKAIIDAMAWMGLHHDEEIVYQSKRIDAHQAALDKLISQKSVYKCYCTPEERNAAREKAESEGGSYIHRCDCRDADTEKSLPYVWRFRMPQEGETVFDDIVQGTIATANREIEDLVVARQDGSPLYNFVVVVDDAFQRVTHVIRGKDHLTNTPKQIQIYKALGLPVPQFAHLPLILGLSKRLRSAGVESYRDQGYLASGLNNYISRLGWSYGDQEIFTFDEIIEKFELKNVNRSEGSLDLQKMEWVNQQHIQNSDGALLTREVVPFLKKEGIDIDGDSSKLAAAVETMRARAKTMVELAQNLKFYFVADDALEYDEMARKKFFTDDAIAKLKGMAAALETVTDWTEEAIAECVNAYIAGHNLKLKDVAQPARVALVGRAAGPGLWETMVVLGKASSIQRLATARTE
ncbi:MAG: glutamate--tRNA ligase [Deltaproteobacteria bacterium]|nr:glutamate--tRNA ligase [Deltaproteobacteria bacterium]